MLKRMAGSSEGTMMKLYDDVDHEIIYYHKHDGHVFAFHFSMDNQPDLTSEDVFFSKYTFDKAGRLSSLADLPAAVLYNKFGNIIAKEWCQGGVLHREDGPAKEHFVYHQGHLGPVSKRRFWYVSGVLHRVDGPAVEGVLTSGNLVERWYVKGELHRDGGLPARVKRTHDGLVALQESWFVNGRPFRDSGPVEITRNYDNEIICSKWSTV